MVIAGLPTYPPTTQKGQPTIRPQEQALETIIRLVRFL